MLRTLGLDRAQVAGWRRRRITWVGVAGLVALVVLVTALRGAGERMNYTTEPARRGELVVKVTATGALQPTNQVQVGSELSGIVLSVEVDFNDLVKKDQVVARLDPTRLQAQVLQSTAALEAARAHVAESEATEAEAAAQLARLEHVRELSGGKVPSQTEYATAVATAARTRAVTASARAAVSQAEATLATQRTDLSKTEIRSPINGIVLSRTVEPGQTVAASLQAPVLFTLAEDLTHMELLVSVDEADVGQVKEGQDAEFSVDAWPDRRFHARVEQLRYGSQTAAGVVSYQAMLLVDNPELLLRPGMTATAEIRVKDVADALLVPNTALRFTPPARAEQERGGILRALLPGGRWNRRPTAPEAGSKREQHVWLLQDGAPRQVAVTTGASDGMSTEITGGTLQPGDELIVGAAGARS